MKKKDINILKKLRNHFDDLVCKDYTCDHLHHKKSEQHSMFDPCTARPRYLTIIKEFDAVIEDIESEGKV